MLDLVLFERYPRGMRLTDAGRKLLPAAADELSAAATGLKGPLLGTLRIGTILDTEFLRLGSFLGVLVNRHPGLAFELRHGISGAVLHEVDVGHLDVAYTLGLPGFPDTHERFHHPASVFSSGRTRTAKRAEGSLTTVILCCIFIRMQYSDAEHENCPLCTRTGLDLSGFGAKAAFSRPNRAGHVAVAGPG